MKSADAWVQQMQSEQIWTTGRPAEWVRAIQADALDGAAQQIESWPNCGPRRAYIDFAVDNIRYIRSAILDDERGVVDATLVCPASEEGE